MAGRGKIFFIMLAAVFISVNTVPKAYSDSKNFREVRDLDGKTVRLPDNVKRVGCFYGPSYEKVYLLHAGDKIAACSEFHIKLSPWAQRIFKRPDNLYTLKGGYDRPNIEQLLGMNLDVIFFWSFPEPVKRIEAAGIPIIHPRKSGRMTLSDAKDLLKFYAEALGPEEVKVARRYCAYFDEKLNMLTSVTSDIPEKKRPRVYSAVRTPLHTGGKYSGIPEVVSLAGGASVQKDLEAGFGREIGVEQLIKWNPDIILIDHCGAKFMGSKPADITRELIIRDKRLSTISAVRKRRVHISPTGVFFWDSGQQIILQMMWMAKIFHPDKFKHIDMKKELRAFYSEFFRYNLSDDEAERILSCRGPED